MAMTRREEVRAFVKDNGIVEAAHWFKLSTETVGRYCRAPSQKKGGDTPILIIPDLHAPYQHKDTIAFLKWVEKEKGCRKRVVCTGDIMDFHSMSRHTSEPDCLSPEGEYEKACEFVAELTAAFPKGDLILGNHDAIPQRQMTDAGLAPSMLRDNNSLYNMPKGWNIHPLYHVIEEWDVLCEHGVGSGGKMGCLNTAILKRCSYVQGHSHSAAAVMYSSNHKSTIFGMNVGCMVDHTSLAQRYGKYGTKKGVLGAGVVYSGSHAEFIPLSSYVEAMKDEV